MAIKTITSPQPRCPNHNIARLGIKSGIITIYSFPSLWYLIVSVIFCITNWPKIRV